MEPVHTSDDRTAHLAALDREVLWHPFTPMRQWRETDPIIIERGAGDFIFDTNGKRYIDGISSLWCNVHGHRVREIDDAVRDQLDRIAHSTMLGLASVPAIELGARLLEILPKGGDRRLGKVFYSDAGATATELAFKMVVGSHFHLGRPNRNTIIAFSGAYHGDTVGAMSVGYSETFHRPFKALTFRTIFCAAPDVTHAPEAEGVQWPWHDEQVREAVRDRCLAEFDRVLQEHEECIAGVAIEPLVQGAAGIVTHPDGFLSGVAARCRDRSIPLIADEVAVGFGRTGTMFACAQEMVVPDVICLAKGLSGGYLPLAATICTDAIEQAFCGPREEERTLYHGHTYTGNPLACAAAIASLDLFAQHNLLARIGEHARLINERLNGLRDHPHVGDIRQRGLMVGIELVADRRPWKPFDRRGRCAAQVCLRARRSGLIIRPLGDTIVLMPMPGMQTSTLERMLTIVIDTIHSFNFR